MSDNVLIVLIIVLAVVIVLYMFRGTLSRFFLKASRDGIETELQTREQGQVGQPESGKSVNVSGNRQVGRKNKIDVGRPDVNVSDNLQLGEDHEIEVDADKKPKRK